MLAGSLTIASRVEVRLEIGMDYARGIAKLAFHYALKQLPWLDGRDPAFEPIRRFILDGTGHPNDFLDLNAEPFAIVFKGERLTDGHFLMANVSNAEGVTVLVKTFVRSPYSRDAIRVRLGPTPSAVPLRLPVVGHHLRLYEGGPRDGYDGELIELATRYLGGRWGVVVAPN